MNISYLKEKKIKHILGKEIVDYTEDSEPLNSPKNSF